MKERNWDIGLAPLEESKFTSCKYFNKYIEYSSYGIAGVYSAVEPYTFGIKDGLNGILCDNTVESWVQALNLLIKDTELTKNISEFAQKELSDKFSVRSVAETIYRETGFCTCDKNAVIKYKKIFAVFSKIKVYSEIYGIMMPVEIIKKAVLKLLNQLKR